MVNLRSFSTSPYTRWFFPRKHWNLDGNLRCFVSSQSTFWVMCLQVDTWKHTVSNLDLSAKTYQRQSTLRQTTLVPLRCHTAKDTLDVGSWGEPDALWCTHCNTRLKTLHVNFKHLHFNILVHGLLKSMNWRASCSDPWVKSDLDTVENAHHHNRPSQIFPVSVVMRASKPLSRLTYTAQPEHTLDPSKI